MNSELVKQHIDKTGVVPVFYHADKDVTINVVKAAYKAGLRAFEFTNRGPEALGVMKELINSRSEFPDMALGIGTIIDAKTALDYIKIGVDFIVAPILDEETAEVCKESNISWTPGCGTLTEVVKGNRLGADLIKLFPGNVIGSGFVKSVKSVIPHIDLMPTGGVKPTKESLAEWFDAGVYCVGMGSQLFNKEYLKNSNWDALENDMLNAVKIAQEIK
ncbi:beta/alpha barrel domain-containing protein [Marinigracilibium pacificum]|uniref:Bifunctional 4-hydroxy-2-oxoglutarate aldolase/2-dehydro-3-deoxy-phosphogluconate aldolase n=1 Tax=Marinigracilibium pacificum TaxID=2729599 RepID=A0A848IYU1_9BACT|nr:bifunctional 4-hydroxy-2-oxoglutarate aldolase/2-dehydro-3-deoxy-phosphogluconate aldolase [Marinigracilibium pacificum]NMM49693.1 bifunctional 4-hydroxy-2-oxoglutarate aldolase/2-dehydro-3-deoxy-phosphogluconate aldolase [Marinigracilibium pacificum]